jgi:preprotein translocase subunit SecF
MTCYNARWMISLSASKSASLRKGGIYCILVSKMNSVFIILNFQYFMSVYIIYSMKHDLFANENSHYSLPDPVVSNVL